MTRKFIITILFVSVVLPSTWGQSDFQKYKAKRQQEFQKYKDKRQKDFDEFRRKRNEEFAKYMSQSWQPFLLDEPVTRPIEKDKEPVIYDERNDHQQKNKETLVEIIPYQKPSPKPQPEPVVPIYENDEANTTCSFVFYGTPMRVRCGDLTSYRLSSTNEKALSSAYLKLTDRKYDNLLFDCLALRKKHCLCDWAYFKLLEAVAAEVCGKGTNEAVFLQGVLFNQSGYRVRFAEEQSNGHLHLLVGTEGFVFDYESVGIKGKTYYLLDKSKVRNLNICNLDMPDEKEMSLHINESPLLSKKMSAPRSIKAKSYGTEVESSVNENLIHFFNDYPTSYANNNFMTRWAYYANTPISTEVKEKIYPQLRNKLQNTTPLIATNILLNWVQTGFVYEKDDVVWGSDRALFAEETLYYPFCDCEDRSILFSHIVRDLVGLDVVLVYYPGHLATAVCFSEEVEGDYIMVKNRKFIVADPTYIPAKVGRTMPGMDNDVAKVILCEKH